MKKHKQTKFEIDFFLLEILTESCWHAGTIVRAMFLEELVEVHYHKMNEGQKLAFWAFLGRLKANESEIISLQLHELVLSRFCPTSQYEVTTDFNGKIETYKAFLMNGKYHVSKNQDINPIFVIEVKQLSVSM